MAAYFDMLCVCTHAQHVKICLHNTDIINNDTHIGTRYVILAKHWMWLTDDGFLCKPKHAAAAFIILTILIT